MLSSILYYGPFTTQLNRCSRALYLLETTGFNLSDTCKPLLDDVLH
jgi:hypothetical protein